MVLEWELSGRVRMILCVFEGLGFFVVWVMVYFVGVALEGRE